MSNCKSASIFASAAQQLAKMVAKTECSLFVSLLSAGLMELEHRFPKPEVAGSNPAGRTFFNDGTVALVNRVDMPYSA